VCWGGSGFPQAQNIIRKNTYREQQILGEEAEKERDMETQETMPCTRCIRQ